VLEITAHKRVGGERAFLAFLRGRIRVAKRHRVIVGRDDALIADRGARNVAREITHDVGAGTGRLDMDPPTVGPDRVTDLRMQIGGGGLERVVKAAAKRRRHCGARQQPVSCAGREPLFAVGPQRSARHDEVQMRMVLPFRLRSRP